MSSRVGSSRAATPAVVFDIDGTLLDSAAGIVAGFQHALASVGFDPPDAAYLRADLGPPVDVLFRSLGVSEEVLAAAVTAYRRFYFSSGLQQAEPYAGVLPVLQTLHRAGIPLATATAKRTDIARAIMCHHGLDGYFAVINGTDDIRTTKAATLGHTLDLLGLSARSEVIMVGDRHSDLTGARACGVIGVGVTWGYGAIEELTATNPDYLIDRPGELLELVVARP